MQQEKYGVYSRAAETRLTTNPNSGQIDYIKLILCPSSPMPPPPPSGKHSLWAYICTITFAL
jgi:hypothetical protein